MPPKLSPQSSLRRVVPPRGSTSRVVLVYHEKKKKEISYLSALLLCLENAKQAPPPLTCGRHRVPRTGRTTFGFRSWAGRLSNCLSFRIPRVYLGSGHRTGLGDPIGWRCVRAWRPSSDLPPILCDLKRRVGGRSAEGAAAGPGRSTPRRVLNREACVCVVF